MPCYLTAGVYAKELAEGKGKRLTKAPRVFLRDSGILHFLLGLEHLWIIYPGDKQYSLTDTITALPLKLIQNIELRPRI